MADANNLVVSNGHVDSLIDYVLDVKPFHTKLSEVVEEYLFEDTVNVSVVSDVRSMAILGLDYTKASQNILRKVWERAPIRPESTLSADKIIASDGRRLTYPFAPILVNKLFSESSQNKFIATNASEIAGLNSGVFSPRHFSGVGIPRVERNGVELVESIGYHISHGAFSFLTNATAQSWQSLQPGAENEPRLGTLSYPKQVDRSFGSVSVDSWDNGYPEEWTITWDADTQTFSVVGSTSGLIGNATPSVLFADARVTFTATVNADIVDGDEFVLTPSVKVYVASDSIDQTWTLIKTNALALVGAPTFTGSLASGTPTLTLYAHGLEWAVAGAYTLTFISATTYTLHGPGYTVENLDVNQSYKDANVHFTINKNGHTFAAAEQFTFTVKDTGGKRRPSYLVYGSLSGWQTPATIGEWYFNGQIGFKIPELTYYPCVGSDISELFFGFEEQRWVHSSAQPSKYTVSFTTGPSGFTTATVENNVYGFSKGLQLGVSYEDDISKFLITGTGPTNKLSIFIAPVSSYPIDVGFDEFPNDEIPFDAGAWEKKYPVDPLQEYFPLYHSKNVVIIPGATAGDEIVIDKVERDYIRFRFNNSPGYQSLLDSDGWVPLAFEYLNADSEPAVFPDKPSTVDIFAASDPNTRIMSVTQAAGQASFLTFDSDFFSEFINSSTLMTIRFHQQSSWAQVINVKISEHLNIDNEITVVGDTSSGDSSSTSFFEGLVINEYESSTLTRTNLIYTPSVHDISGLHVDSVTTSYVVTLTEPADVQSVTITADSGSTFNVPVNNSPYDQIPAATSTMSFSFTVPDGTGPFTVICSTSVLTGLGYGLGLSLGT
jgi:hypothetical protein